MEPDAVVSDVTLENEGLAEFWTEVGCVVVGVDMADVEDDGADSILNSVVAYTRYRLKKTYASSIQEENCLAHRNGRLECLESQDRHPQDQGIRRRHSAVHLWAAGILVSNRFT